MLRFRRYRIFLMLAAVLTFALIRISSNKKDDRSSTTFSAFRHTETYSELGLSKSPHSSEPVVDVEKLAHLGEGDSQPIAPPAQLPYLEPTTPSKTKLAEDPISDPKLGGAASAHHDDHVPTEPLSSASKSRWKKQKEHFPVPPGSIIPLPTGTPLSIPLIQHKFPDETPDGKVKREIRQSKVKDEFIHAWHGYKKFAWGHDEVRPVTGAARDPFCGWAASLVDALDTLWIMGLVKEFEEAVAAVQKIDFTTTLKSEIPVFETVIRYLGGLLAAYDVSEGKYPALLDKAKELAEVLMGVFDTPNRMPLLHYQWRPIFAQNPHRAGTRANLAELGSLSMEFTRLAQLTKENKYYDAVTRVTDALEEWQKRGTELPGVFPDQVDASGCNHTATYLTHNTSKDTRVLDEPTGYEAKMPGAQTEPIPNRVPSSYSNGDLELQVIPGQPSKGRLEKVNVRAEEKTITSRQVQLPELAANSATAFEAHGVVNNSYFVRKFDDDWDCVKQGLDGANAANRQSFSMGGGQDSTYEYFPKYLLLGGLEDRYREMYLKTMEAVRKYMLFRPMVPDSQDILVSGKWRGGALDPELTHLTCFIGGMVGMGAKIFDLKDDLEIAKKLTDGCVWAYSSTSTGIMPEGGKAVPCESKEVCPWNETTWWRHLDPQADDRLKNIQIYEENKAAFKSKKLGIVESPIAITTLPTYSKVPATAEASYKLEARDKVNVDSDVDVDLPPPISTRYEESLLSNSTQPTMGRGDDEQRVVSKPTTPESHDDIINPDTGNSTPVDQKPRDLTQQKLEEKKKDREVELGLGSLGRMASSVGTPTITGQLPPNPVPPLTHEEYVKGRLERENLPKGYSSVYSASYILRPEAIESVWYMYRITGDPSWQEKGWVMFEAIIAATRTTHGHSAILDVNVEQPKTINEMESFWLSETLKYFYLLFSTPDVISLDEWVLNTEAHPFKRPV